MDSYVGPHAGGRWEHAALIYVTSGHWDYYISFSHFELLRIDFETFERTCFELNFELVTL